SVIEFESPRLPSRRQKLEKVGQTHCFQSALDRHWLFSRAIGILDFQGETLSLQDVVFRNVISPRSRPGPTHNKLKFVGHSYSSAKSAVMVKCSGPDSLARRRSSDNFSSCSSFRSPNCTPNPTP